MFKVERHHSAMQWHWPADASVGMDVLHYGRELDAIAPGSSVHEVCGGVKTLVLKTSVVGVAAFRWQFIN